MWDVSRNRTLNTRKRIKILPPFIGYVVGILKYRFRKVRRDNADCHPQGARTSGFAPLSLQTLMCSFTPRHLSTTFWSGLVEPCISISAYTPVFVIRPKNQQTQRMRTELVKRNLPDHSRCRYCALSKPTSQPRFMLRVTRACLEYDRSLWSDSSLSDKQTRNS